MRYITFLNVSVRVLILISIFIFVKEQSDYLLVPVLNSLGACLGGVISIYILIYKENIVLTKPSFIKLKFYFLESLPVFTSALSIELYVKSNKILIGSFLGMEELTIYDFADKVTSLLKVPIGMISQTTFPKISRELNIAFINKIMFLALTLVSVLYAVVFVFSELIIQIILSSISMKANDILKILSFSALISTLNYFLGANRLLPFGYKKYYLLNTIFSCLAYFIGFGVVFFINRMDLYVLCYLYLSSEIIGLVLNLHRNNQLNLLFKKNIIS